jgi:hypothetical protein
VDPDTRELQESILETPIAIGSDAAQLPENFGTRSMAHLVVTGAQVAGFHALITEANQRLTVTEQGNNCIWVNAVPTPNTALQDGDTLRVGEVNLQVQTNFALGGDAAGMAAGLGEGGCDRQIGFLIKRRCGRTSAVGCNYCDNGRRTTDPYYDDYAGYPGYGRYDSGYWGHSYYYDRDRYYYDPNRDNVDFTDADNASLGDERDVDYEEAMGAS